MKTRLVLILAFLTSATSVFAESTINLVSETGDFIGQGETYFYSDENADITYDRNYDNGITVRIRNLPDDPYLYWTMQLAAPEEAEIKAGFYDGAERFPFQEVENPGLSFSGNGRGCNTLSGSFEVYEVSYDVEGVVTGLSASFEQYCGNSNSALRGDINYNVIPPVGVSAIGLETYRAMCKNRTTGEKLFADIAAGETFVGCKKMGLIINVGDDIEVTLRGIAEQ